MFAARRSLGRCALGFWATLLAAACGGQASQAPAADGGQTTDGTARDSTTPVEAAGDEASDASNDVWLPDNPCPPPMLTPPGGSATSVVMTAPGLPSYPVGRIFYTTNGLLPDRHSAVYTAGAQGIPLAGATKIAAFSSTLGAACVDSVMVVGEYNGMPSPDAAGE